ncbi:tripartite tricarboxylate transporter permease [Fodinicurvata sp. EGI_FJ10296]|uniref:tripartite tricarboxylate transporter permease n=1 Tax=Fodinicurvata sp. EGI_FJ10296 TaxID=3231908 RepID=UPI0034563A9E
MIDLADLSGAFALLGSSWTPWLVVIPGLMIGLIFGCIPGLQTSMAMAVFLPATLTMDFLTAMLFLTAIFTGGQFGGGVSAILMNIPGTSSAVATTFDGYPMSRQGRHNEALGVALIASTIGTLTGYFILLVLIQPLSTIVLKLGPTEMFVVILWGLTLIATLKGKHLSRSLLAGVFGLLIGTIGMSPNGVMRGTLGSAYLIDGIAVVPAMIGMFAASELFSISGNAYLVKGGAAGRRVSFRRVIDGLKLGLKSPSTLLRGGIIGVLVGAVPGVGSSVANLVSYSEARRRSKDPSSFGQGNPNGVAASESANSSSEGGSMVSLFALGIPGGAGTAILLAAFTMHNITGGPGFLRDQGDVAYAVIMANLVQGFLLFFVGLLMIQLLAAIVKVPLRYLIPGVLAMSAFGSYGLTGNMAGPITLLVFAMFGWALRRYDYSIPAAVIGLLLGSMAEGELLRSYQISGGRIEYVFERPITFLLLALLILSLWLPRLMERLRRKAAGRSDAAEDIA